MYYKCTSDLWSKYIPNLLKFSKDGIYESIKKDVYINNQGDTDYIAIEKWQHFFVPFDLDEINIDEIKEILESEIV